MIGLGKWTLDTSIPFIKVKPICEIRDDGGRYGFSFDLGSVGAVPDVNLLSVTEVNYNTLSVGLNIPKLNIIGATAQITFDGNRCFGVIQVPGFGKINVKGVKVKG